MRPWVTMWLLVLMSIAVHGADLTGEWTLHLLPDFSGHEDQIGCAIRQQSQTLTVDCGAGSNIVGDVKGRTVTLAVKTGRHNEYTATFTGELDASETTITGGWQLMDAQGRREGRFTLTKTP
jgi:hypothetical protein